MSEAEYGQIGVCDHGLKGIPLHQGPHPKDPYCENWRLDPAIEEAVRVVDGMTCKWCGWGYDRITLDTNQHMLSRENGGKFEPCTKQGRAIIDELVRRGLMK